MMSSKLLTICCVLRSGGDYSPIYVEKLKIQLFGRISVPYRFVCFTDFTNVLGGVPLEFNYKGWWSKLEIFKFSGPVIYLDLDTIIAGSLDPLVEMTLRDKDSFNMIEGFNKRRKFASGIMSWNGDYSFILKEFHGIDERKRWDQDYIIAKVKVENINSINSEQKGIYSYKKHCQDGLPDDATIVCFHGNPRPHQINHGWVAEKWN